MRVQLLLSVLLLAICGQSSPVAPAEQESSLEQRAKIFKSPNIWPIKESDRSKHQILYCVKTTNDDIEGKVKRGLALAMDFWTNPPALRQWTDKHNKKFDLPIEWKLTSCPSDEKDVLIISDIDGKEVFTTLGYKSGTKHTMEIGRDLISTYSKKDPDFVARLAHELGRNIGLLNDNQANGKKYIISCSNINGYDNMVKTNGKDKTRKACKDYDTAKEIGWKEAMNIAPVSKDDLEDGTGPTFKGTDRMIWDMESIMRLPSTIYGRKSRLTSSKKYTVITQPWYPTIPVRWYQLGPTAWDLQAVVKMYTAQETAHLLEEAVEDVQHDPNEVPPEYDDAFLPPYDCSL